MTAPFSQTVEETRKHIASIEHNDHGTGPGPAGKRAGAPTGVPDSGGSGQNVKSGGDYKESPCHKGDDWVSSHS